MKNHIIPIIALLAVLCGCKGGESVQDTQDYITDKDKLTHPPYLYQYSITGKVICSACKPENFMHVNIEDEDDNSLINTPWSGQFGDGTYKFAGVNLEAGQRVTFRVFIDGIYPIGKKSEAITLPEDNTTAVTAPTVTIP